MPRIVLLAMVGGALMENELNYALAFFLSYHCMLRTGETLLCKFHDICIGRGGIGVLTLPCTKIGQRKGSVEHVEIFEAMVGRLLSLLVARPFPETVLLPFGPFRYRDAFLRMTKIVGIEHIGFTPYSFRRCGASHVFSVFRSFERTMSRGRWAALRTARIYVQEATLALTELTFTSEQLALFHRFAALTKLLI
jgi:integrase